MTLPTTFVMDALTKTRQSFIEAVNKDFREWANKNGADSGIRTGLPTRTTGKGILPRVQAIPSNLTEFDQTFECACGFQTHVAGKFWDHVNQQCPITTTKYTPMG